ncbi:hypothetical protein [Faecalibacter sp. LW9]|uniref:hypothetical protein n=1 Tax=Faecalibacter sp. LW9 TaxID=3103144 RepID=UPI002AFFCBF4|nr:hypothetical protein [Faecalibacter sp. LW9]
MKSPLKFSIFMFMLLILFSFTDFLQEKIKIIRYTKTTNGFLVVEYSDGVIKKQVKRNQIMVYNLPFADKNTIEKEITQLNFHHIQNEIDSVIVQKPIPAVANMYMFIKGSDTIKTGFFSKEQTPQALRKLDFLLHQNRK